LKKAIITLIVIAVIVTGALFAKNKLSAASPADKTQFKIALAETATVKKTVSATGTLQPWTFVDIKSKAGGRVDALMVDVGTKVKKGQKLALIDPSDTQLSVDQAQADMNSADARIVQSTDTAHLQVKQSDLGVETARAALATAIAGKDAAYARMKTSEEQMNAQPALTSATVESARANVDNAEKQLAEMVDATNSQERSSAESALDQAQANLKNADANLSRQKSLMDKGFVSLQVVDQALASRDVMKAQVTTAKQKLDTLQTQQSASTAAMKARLAQAQAQYANAKAGSVDINIRKSSYNEAKASYIQSQKQVENARKSVELAIANKQNVQIKESDIRQAEATKMRAAASFKNAKTTLDQTVVTAPTDGVVLKKYVDAGTIISSALSFAATGNNIIQIGDVTKMYVDVTVDETDIANVEDGQAVDVTIEAYPGVPFEGKVSRIDPQAIVEQNVTNIHVRVEIDNSDVKFQLLKPGMNATCEFVKDKKENVLAVPTEAVHTDDQGKRFVEIAVGGTVAPVDPKSGAATDPNTLVDVKPVRREVQVELEGNENMQITGGLKEGEKVVVQKIEAVVQAAGGALGNNRGPGGFGGGRGR
jgi:HlyD family secretion protein